MKDSIINALIGGSVIGLAASLTLLLSGRVAGISNILGGIVSPHRLALSWRVSFILGLLVGGVVLALRWPDTLQEPTASSSLIVAIAGILVGFGTQMSRGCTSGHGVCGLSRLSKRSLVATLTFMGTGAAAATLLALFTGATT